VLLALGLGCPPDRDSSSTDSSPETNPPDSGETDDSPPGETDESGPLETGEVIDTDPPPEGCAGNSNPGPLAPGMCVADAPCTLVGEQGYEYLGWSVAAGDLDGDGRGDLLVGSPTYDATIEDESMADAGRVQLISGASLDQADGEPQLQLTGMEYAEQLGSGMSMAGDVNGDGQLDLLVGAMGNDAVLTNAGAAYLLLGPSTDWTTGTAQASAAASFLGLNSYGRVGKIMAGGGDTDGDGLHEILLAGDLYTDGDDRSTGCAYLVMGMDTGWSLDTSVADAQATFKGTGSLDQAGMGLVLRGDFDGDGYADPALGSPYAASYLGRASVYQGGPGSLAGTVTTEEATVVLGGEGVLDAYGWALAAGDLDGDGADELMVGAPLGDRPYDAAGEVYIYAGATDFFEGPGLLATLQGSWEDQQFGTSLQLGDLDDDGLADLLVGAVGAYSGIVTKNGRVDLFLGASTTWAEDTSCTTAHASFHGAGVKDYLGSSAALGDLNGDGHDDLLLPSAYANVDSAYDVGQLSLFWGE